jgi:hypothetical protein
MEYIEHTGRQCLLAHLALPKAALGVRPCSPGRRATPRPRYRPDGPRSKVDLFLKINFSQVGQRGRWANDKQDHWGVNRPCLCAGQLPSDLACRRSYPWCSGLGQGGFARRSQPRVEELAEIASGNLLVHGLEILGGRGRIVVALQP